VLVGIHVDALSSAQPAAAAAAGWLTMLNSFVHCDGHNVHRHGIVRGLGDCDQRGQFYVFIVK